MGKHSAPEGHGGVLPEDEYVGTYTPVAIPESAQCCSDAELASKVQQIDDAYGEPK